METHKDYIDWKLRRKQLFLDKIKDFKKEGLSYLQIWNMIGISDSLLFHYRNGREIPVDTLEMILNKIWIK